MGISILLSRVLVTVLAVGCTATSSMMDSTPAGSNIAPAAATTSYSYSAAMPDTLKAISFEASTGKPTDFDASGDIVRVEIYSGDKQILIGTVEDKDTLAYLNSEESTQTDTLWQNRPLMGKEADAAAAQVKGTEEYVFSLYRDTDAGPEWLCDITTYTGSYLVRWYMSMGGIETYGLFDDPMVSYQNAKEEWADYLRSLV